MTRFCFSPLWDSNLTWYTNEPDFTPCFQQTVLVYVPSLVLFIFTPLQVYFARQSQDKHVPWTPLITLKLAFSTVLLGLSVVDLIYALASAETEAPAYYLATALRILSFADATFLLLLNRSMGITSSGLLFNFWTLVLFADGVIFRSAIINTRNGSAVAAFGSVFALIRYPFEAANFFLNCWADSKPKQVNLNDQVENLTPEKYSSFPSRVLFGWVDPLMYQGWKKTLRVDDLWTLLHENRCDGIVPAWDKAWENVTKKATMKGRPVSIAPAVLRAFGPAYFLSALLMFFLSVLQFASPQIVNLLIDFVKSDEPDWKGYFYTFLICLVTFLVTVLNAQSFFLEYLVGLRVRTALMSAIYRKSLKLSNAARKQMTVGETTNLMQIDTQKFMDLCLYLNLIWTSPLQIALALYFLWGFLGPSSLAGLAVMILMIPLNAVIAARMKKLQISQMKNKDNRSRLMDEILNGIKIIKLYAWELSFKNKVLSIREKEIRALKKMAYYNAGMTFLWTCAPVIISLASFATFVLVDPENNILDANTAFVSLTLFNLLRVPLNLLPVLLVYMVQCQVSLTRVNRYMNSNELQKNIVGQVPPESKDAIAVKNGSFSWEKNSPPVLHNIDLQVPKGSLVALVGPVGAGKSSLVSAVLGEMEKLNGEVNIRGRVSYVPQQAWIQNGTVKYNITFGKKFDKRLYERVLEACALTQDLQMLPAGDKTEIGEKGINMSGGQKQRISMARAVYNGGDLFYLDDPLSAVDSHVGAHIFQKVIGPNGMLKDKTRILVTHSAKYLPNCDQIIVLKEGKISEQGSYRELLNDGGDFAEFLIQYLTEEETKDSNSVDSDGSNAILSDLVSVMGKEKVKKQLSVAKSKFSGSSLRSHETVEKDRKRRSYQRQDSHMTVMTEAESAVGQVAGQILIEEEKAVIGGVKWDVYFYYGRSLGIWMALLSVALYLLYQGFSVASSIWLSIWSTDPLASTDTSVRDMYLGVYGALGFLQSALVMIATVVLSVACLNAATRMHSKMLSKILRSPMSFFDTTPIGRILNRFSKDIDIIDVTIPMILRSLVGQILNVIGTVVIICYANVIFIAVVIPIGIAYYLVQKFYVATARQVKRLESITRSPIYSHFGETISGAPTIRAFAVTERFIQENEKKIDINQICYYPTFSSSRWLAVRLECIGNIVILFASLFAVFSRDKMDPGLVGLSLSYALTVTNSMSFLVSMTSEIETNMVSVERIKEYQEINEEAPLEMPEQDPPPEWPSYGVVKFDNYQTRYRDGLELVLKGIDCKILSGEKIGIVGRTGAGKSSLTLALFRIIEAASGSIFIDDQNIGLMGLQKLRSRLTIIPQDPVLFSGSIRMNLDPFSEQSDKAIWIALEHAHLKSFIENIPQGLNFEVNEGGENLSVGQRQLICLARALLRKTKVLILDEATAAVDLETDDLIQATIRKEFSDCTVLTIAHRLNTIMDSSRVMVLDKGKVVEFDTPDNLLLQTDSIFYGMVKEAGLLKNEPSAEIENQEADLIDLRESEEE